MTPYLVTPPASLPVALADLKADPVLRIEGNDADAAITMVQAGCVADLDGWKGWLGRCIMPQTWAVDVIGPGPHLLPFPDASNVAAVSDAEPLAVTVARTAMGQTVTVADAEPDQAVTISAVYGLPASDLPGAQLLVTLMVKRHYDAVHGSEYDAYTRTIEAQVARLRWRRV